jgi:signal transduction histidine kinase
VSEAIRVLLAGDDAHVRLIAECIRAFLPSCEVVTVDAAAVARGEAPAAACAVVAPGFGGWSVLEGARSLRAAGYEGALVVVVEAPDAAEARAGLDRLGAHHTIAMESLTSSLPAAVLEASRLDESAPLVQEVRRAQRLMAAGEIARKVQHDVNNPLTALLAEAQLLEMEPMSEEQRQAVNRIIDLCRRAAAVVRRLDVVAPTPSAASSIAQPGKPAGSPMRGNGGRA